MNLAFEDPWGRENDNPCSASLVGVPIPDLGEIADATETGSTPVANSEPREEHVMTASTPDRSPTQLQLPAPALELLAREAARRDMGLNELLLGLVNLGWFETYREKDPDLAVELAQGFSDDELGIEPRAEER